VERKGKEKKRKGRHEVSVLPDLGEETPILRCSLLEKKRAPAATEILHTGKGRGGERKKKDQSNPPNEKKGKRVGKKTKTIQERRGVSRGKSRKEKEGRGGKKKKEGKGLPSITDLKRGKKRKLGTRKVHRL